MTAVFLRILIIYILLIGTLRFMGKRQIGELQLSELITTILLSELASAPVTDTDVPLTFAIIPIAVLLSLEVIISYATTKLPFLKNIFDGKPEILIRHGKLDKGELLKARISIEELLSSIRLAGVSSVEDVDYTIHEQNGQISVIPKRSASPPNSDELELQISECGIAHALIVDSKISDFDLKLIGKNRKWLQKRLSAHSITAEHVLLFTVDDIGREFLIKK